MFKRITFGRRIIFKQQNSRVLMTLQKSWNIRKVAASKKGFDTYEKLQPIYYVQSYTKKVITHQESYNTSAKLQQHKQSGNI